MSFSVISRAIVLLAMVSSMQVTAMHSNVHERPSKLDLNLQQTYLPLQASAGVTLVTANTKAALSDFLGQDRKYFVVPQFGSLNDEQFLDSVVEEARKHEQRPDYTGTITPTKYVSIVVKDTASFDRMIERLKLQTPAIRQFVFVHPMDDVGTILSALNRITHPTQRKQYTLIMPASGRLSNLVYTRENEITSGSTAYDGLDATTLFQPYVEFSEDALTADELVAYYAAGKNKQRDSWPNVVMTRTGLRFSDSSKISDVAVRQSVRKNDHADPRTVPFKFASEILNALKVPATIGSDSTIKLLIEKGENLHRGIDRYRAFAAITLKIDLKPQHLASWKTDAATNVVLNRVATSSKSGRSFEARAIKAYVGEFGKDPWTNEPITVANLRDNAVLETLIANDRDIKDVDFHEARLSQAKRAIENHFNDANLYLFFRTTLRTLNDCFPTGSAFVISACKEKARPYETFFNTLVVPKDAAL